MKRIWCITLIYMILGLNAGAKGGSDATYNFATINIRVQTSKDSLNPWSIRKELMVDFVRQERLDIACMQEVSAGQLRYLAKAMPEYSVVGDSPKVVKGEEYLPIFYKKGVFTCLDSGTFWLSETPDIAGSKGWDGKNTRRATWAKLKEENSEKTFFVVNTHLDHVGKEARVKGMEVIKRRLKSVAEAMPVMLCGDMNSNSTSPAYYGALNDSFIMYDAYQVARKREGVNYSYHAFGKTAQEKRIMIDFIFVTEQIEVVRILIPQEEQRNGAYLTDHCPVVVEFNLGN